MNQYKVYLDSTTTAYSFTGNMICTIDFRIHAK